MRPDQSQGNLPVDLAGRMTFGDLEAFRIDLAHQKTAHFHSKTQIVWNHTQDDLLMLPDREHPGKKPEEPY